ncbi:hypothetical protein LguiB_002670 [Lonicera macranthoides]
MKIFNISTVVDLFINKFRGKIPQSIGNLKGLQSLNFFNNDLVGPIPPSLWELSRPESLDLSQTKLYGSTMATTETPPTRTSRVENAGLTDVNHQFNLISLAYLRVPACL